MVKNKELFTEKRCDIHVVLRWLGFSGHKWERDNVIYKHCKKCGVTYRLIEFDGIFETWRDTNENKN